MAPRASSPARTARAAHCVWGASLVLALVSCGFAVMGARWPVVALAGGWLLASLLLAMPYCRRFGGTRVDGLQVGLGLGALFVLPLVPLAWSPPSRLWTSLLFTGAGLLLTWWQASNSLLQQGCYFLTERSLPELTGEPLRTAQDVLARCGLKPLSVRVGTLGSLNALVQGLRSCIVVLDRDCTRMLTPDELRALLAHEAGHVRTGGIFPFVAVLPALLVAVNWLRWPITPGHIYQFLAAWLCVYFTTSQALEIVCDAFAARIAGSDATCSMLQKVVANQDRATAWKTRQLWLAPFLSHPPLPVRLAFLGRGNLKLALSYDAALSLLCGLVAFVPLAVSAWDRRGTLLLAGDVRVGTVVAVVSIIYLALHGGVVIALPWLLRRRQPGTIRAVSVRKWQRVLMGAVAGGWLASLAFLFAGSAVGASPAWQAASLCGFLGAILLTLVAVAFRTFRFGPPVRDSAITRAAAECHAALAEGLPGECLSIAEKHLQSDPSQPTMLALRANALFLLGRLDEAFDCIQPIRAGGETGIWALRLAWLIEWYRGRVDASRELENEVFRVDPEEESLWRARGFVALLEDRLEAADAALARACELKSPNASALALRAIVAFASPSSLSPGEMLLTEARCWDPGCPNVLLAESRRAALRGDAAAAGDYWERSRQALERLGMPVVIPRFAELARRWGIPGP